MNTYVFGGRGWSNEGKVLDDFLGVLSLSCTRLPTGEHTHNAVKAVYVYKSQQNSC